VANLTHHNHNIFHMDKRLEKTFDNSLRDIPDDPKGLKQVTEELAQSLLTTTDPKKRVSILGEVGVHLRSLGNLESAESYLLEALEIVKKNQLGIQFEIQQKIRLAHVLQWKLDFKSSDALFSEIIAVCRSNNDAVVYLDFALQHAGKNFFDQRRLKEALIFFEEAIELRLKRKAPQDQIDSTSMAIQRTKILLGE
jgi:tetratricopeptide (TPR) repeat protein